MTATPDALRRIADFLETSPGVAEDVTPQTLFACVTYAENPAERIVSAARSAVAAGIPVSVDEPGPFHGIRLHFGPLSINVFAKTEQVPDLDAQLGEILAAQASPMPDFPTAVA